MSVENWNRRNPGDLKTSYDKNREEGAQRYIKSPDYQEIVLEVKEMLKKKEKKIIKEDTQVSLI